MSSWAHVADRIKPEADMYAGDCPRRSQFRSWTWAGWQGSVVLCKEKQSRTHQMENTNKFVGVVTMLPGPTIVGKNGEVDTAAVDPSHSDFFKALTSKDWVNGLQKIWSAEMMLHDTEGMQATWLKGWTSARTVGDTTAKWLLTIKKPLVMRHLNLMHSAVGGEWRRLMGKIVSVHLSIPITEAQLVEDHRSGHLVTVLVFASMVPYVYNGIALYLILRRADGIGLWERIGGLNLWMTEKDMNTYKTPDDMVSALPVI